MTGLRRKELGSLTPRSFDLDGGPPTVTVQAALLQAPAQGRAAASSRVGRHASCLAEKSLLLGKGSFRAWKKTPDSPHGAAGPERTLESPLETDDGIADFHAAGRHTHITELLRNGATLPEAKELARHSDIKMTMKYTHIGLGDQARAVANLPAPRPALKALPAPADDPALHGRCKSGGSESLALSSSDSEPDEKCDVKSRDIRTLDAGCRCLAASDKMGPLGLEPRTNRL